MILSLPHTTLPQWPVVRPERFAAQIELDDPADCQLALLGLPDDTGIKLNSGRPGAAQGPQAFRNALASFGAAWDAQTNKAISARVYDAGDIIPANGDDEAALLETHARVEAAVRLLHQNNLIPICIGGGHDLTLPAVSALAKHLGKPMGGINLDAHLDVRETAGSGMAFRKLIERNHLNPHCFVELGIGRFANPEASIQWANQQGIHLIPEHAADTPGSVDAFASAFKPGESGFVSIDLDCLSASHAPGVSAMNPSGLSVVTAAKVAARAGSHPAVRHFDLMELCPLHDHQHRTARIAAYLFLSFVAGCGVQPS